MPDMCETCIKVKDKPMTYTKCRICNNWRKMTDDEIAQAKKPWRFPEGGRATRKY